MAFPWYLEVLKGYYYTPCPPYEQPINNIFSPMVPTILFGWAQHGLYKLTINYMLFKP
jgi:hypothetical protein